MKGSAVAIRSARPDEAEAVRRVELAAFPTAAEADLIEALAAAGDVTLSLVAEEESNIVGHLLCSRMLVDADGGSVRAVGLGPVAVLPASQRQGIGRALIEAAVDRSRAAGEAMMFVLGEPLYYGRFGFTAEAARPFASPYAGDYFMALWLSGERPVSAGRAAYAPAFAALEGA